MGYLTDVEQGLFSWLGRIFGSTYSIRYGDQWVNAHGGIRWTSVRETESGVQLRRAFSDVYENMDTGETVILERKDVKKEWHKKVDRREWPERVDRVMRRGEVWFIELDNSDLPPMRGLIVSNSGEDMWRRVEDAREPDNYY